MLAKSMADGWYTSFGQDSAEEWVRRLDEWLGMQEDWGCCVNGREPSNLLLTDEYRVALVAGEVQPLVLECPKCGAIAVHKG